MHPGFPFFQYFLNLFRRCELSEIRLGVNTPTRVARKGKCSSDICVQILLNLTPLDCNVLKEHSFMIA